MNSLQYKYKNGAIGMFIVIDRSELFSSQRPLSLLLAWEMGTATVQFA